MTTVNSITVLAIVLTVCYRLKDSMTDAKEYCHNEQFVAKCPDNDLILITSAMYGRMRVGKCVKEGFGYLECYADVTRHIHERCSGRPSCAIRVPDATLDGTKPCNEDLKSYLDVNFTCIKVGGVGASIGDSCELAADDEVFTGFLSNRLSSTTSKLCGSTESPWTIRVLPGQRINLTLLDFSSGPLSLKGPSPATPCDLYAVLQEADGISGTNVCGTGRVQSLHVYTSVGNSLKVVLKPRKVNSTNNFVFRYDAIGCRDFETPPNAWIRRGDGGGMGGMAAGEMTVGCDGSDEVWQVVCDGNRWEGTTRNCSAVSSKDARREEGLSSLSLGASILTILGVSMTIGLIVLIVGLFYMRSKRIGNVIGQELAMRDLKPLSSATAVYDTTVVYARNKAFEPVKVNIVRSPVTSAGAGKPGQGSGATEAPSDYEYVWDSPSNMASGHVATCPVASKTVDNGPDLLKVTSCAASTSAIPRGGVTLPKKEMGRRFERQAGTLGRGGAAVSALRKPEMGPIASSSSSSSSSSSPRPSRPAFDATDSRGRPSCTVNRSGSRDDGLGSQKTLPTRGSNDLLATVKRSALPLAADVPPPLAVRQHRRC